MSLALVTALPAGPPPTAPPLTPARRLPAERDGTRLLLVDPRRRRLRVGRMRELPELFAPGDLLVLNDAATLPASFAGRDSAGQTLEVRLLGLSGPAHFQAVLLGAGDWRQRTEDRPPPPPLAPGDHLLLGDLPATVIARSPVSPRLVELELAAAGDELWAALYRNGRPVQYAHLDDALPLWAVQNVYAARPWAVEMPSAGRALTWRLLLALRARGAELATVTHAAGLSATGDATLDALLPLPERYDLPAATVAAVARARDRGGRVVAVGTSVVRALEGAWARDGQLRAGAGVTDLHIGPRHRPTVVDGVLSGLHGPGESHHDLLTAFADADLLEQARALAARRGLRSHELGDSLLVLP